VYDVARTDEPPEVKEAGLSDNAKREGVIPEISRWCLRDDGNLELRSAIRVAKFGEAACE
jgi:hypothetical protein